MSRAQNLLQGEIPNSRPHYITEKNWDRLAGHVVNGKTMREIARCEGVSVTAVRNSIYTAMRQINRKKDLASMAAPKTETQKMLRDRRYKVKMFRVGFVTKEGVTA